MLAKYLFVVLSAVSLALTQNVTTDFMEDAVDAIVADLIPVLSLLAQIPKLETGIPDCNRDIERWKDGVTKMDEWALRVLDASSYSIPGFINGNLGNLGNFDECVETRIPGEENNYWALYSLVELWFERRGQADNELLRYPDRFGKGFLKQLLNVNATVIEEAYHHFYKKLFSAPLDLGEDSLETDKSLESNEWKRKAPLYLGICLPRSCGPAFPRKIMKRLLSVANDMLISIDYRLTVDPPVPGDETVGLPTKLGIGDWSVIFVCILLTLTMAFGTGLDLYMSRKPDVQKVGWVKHFVAFSVYTNGRKLLTVKERNPNSLSAMHGLKFFSMLWIILGHRYTNTVQMFIPTTNFIKMILEAKAWPKTLLLAANVGVDTFFTLGGILSAYVFFIIMAKQKKLNIYKFFIHRYIRITPAMILPMAVAATLYYHLGSGPFWNKYMGEQRLRCRNYWWYNFLYISNHFEKEHRCMGFLWYLMVDMQMHWFSILVLVPLWHYRKTGLAWLIFLIGVSCAIPFTIAYTFDFRIPLPLAASLGGDSDRFLYTPTYSRASPYLVGILFGYFLYHIRFVMPDFRLGSKNALAGWTLCTALALTVILAQHPLYEFQSDIEEWKCALYIGLHRMAWSFSIGWIVLACSTGYGGPVNTILSWPPIIVLSRLVYGMYLSHLSLQLADFASMRTPLYFSDYDFVLKLFSDSIASMILALLIALCVEYPLRNLEKSLLGGSVQETEPANNAKDALKVYPLNDFKTQL